MTTFVYPVLTKTADGDGPGPFRLVMTFQTTIDIAKTGTAANSVTTIPLFVAPAGATFDEVIVDVLDPYDNLTTNNTNIQIGVAGETARLLAPTSLNTVGRRVYAPTSAMVSANTIPLAADTQINALVSINTSAVTVGRAIITIYMK